MRGLELNDAIRLLCLVIISILFLTSVYSTEVPKSETVIIPGELNDTLENAQYFNIQEEYTYGTNNASQPQQLAQGMQAMAAEIASVSSFRKTYVPKNGVMLVTLNNDAGSEYSVEVYNSCKQNLCNPRILSPTQKHCLINIVPDYYYFKVTRLSGTGSYILDVDYLNGNNDSAPTAKTCSPPAIIDYYPARQVDIEMTYYPSAPKEFFNVTAIDKERTNLNITWHENGVQTSTGNHYLFVPRKTGVYNIKAVVSNEAYSNEIDWNVNVYDPIIECSFDSDCEEPNLSQNSYCGANNSVYSTWTNYTCINPRLKISYCKENTEERLIETCKNMCFNGSCNPQPFIECPTEDINNNYSFKWNALDYNASTSIEFSSDSNFKTKKSIIVTKTNTLQIKNYFKTLVDYEKNSKENKIYSRIVGKNKSGKTSYSKVCQLKTAKETKSILTCPNEPITETYTFNFLKNDNLSPSLQLSYSNLFTFGKTMTLNPNNKTLIPIKSYYSTLLTYETKSINKKLYAKITGKDSYGRDTTSEICEFNLKPQIQPTLSCPTQNIDSNYSFKWTAGDYNSIVLLELAYKNNFITKTAITTTKINPTPILKYFNTLKIYSTKNSTKEIYARITAKNKYNQTTTSNICIFKLATTNLSDGKKQPLTAYFSTTDTRTKSIPKVTTSNSLNPTNSNNQRIIAIPKTTQNLKEENLITPKTNLQETILSQTTELNENGDTTTIKVTQVTNDDGEIETRAEYEINENPLTQYTANSSLINSSSTTCTYNTSSKTVCEKKGDSMKLNNNSTTLEIRYTYIDCTTGEILGKGQLCPGESGPWHHVPKEHTAKFEYKKYQCPNNGCKTETLDLCSGVTCSNYCLRELKNYNGYCNQGVCKYTYLDCPIDCSEGQCTSNNCTAGWKCFNSIEKAYQNSNCDWSNNEYCPNGCTNGTCNSQTCTKGWKCYNSTKKGYQDSDCSWSDKTTCEYGCENGTCKTNTCSTGWKCMDSETKAYQKSNCSWINDTYCKNGCLSGSCIADKVPGDSDYCTEEEQCEAGEGNCTTGNQCQPGLYCMPNVGTNYGYSSTTNVCEAKEGVGEWKCYNSNTAGFKFYSDSSWSDLTNCPNGCTNGACVSSIIQGTDTDKDGYSNDDEILAGSDPYNFNSTPFTEFAKYSEEIKGITKMNEGQVFTDILLPFLAQKQSFDGKKTQKINKLYFSSKDTNRIQLSIMNPVAGHIGFILGKDKGGLLAIDDTVNGIISLIGLPAFIGESILSFGTYITNFNKVSDDLDNFYDFLAHSTVTYDSVTGTVDSTGKTLNLIWNSYFGEKFKEGLEISENIPFIVQDDEDKRSFAYSYASGYTGGYILTTAASFGFGAGEVKAIISGIKLGKLGSIVEVYIKVVKYPKLILLIIKGDETSQITINLVNKYTARLVNEVLEKKSTIQDIMQIAENEKGIVWLEKGKTGPNGTGWLHIEEKRIKTGAFRNAGIDDAKIQETIFKSIIDNPKQPIPSKTGNGFCYILEGVAKYPIITVVGSNGYIVTSYPKDDLTEFICK